MTSSPALPLEALCMFTALMIGHRAFGFHSADPLIAMIMLLCSGTTFSPFGHGNALHILQEIQKNHTRLDEQRRLRVVCLRLSIIRHCHKAAGRLECTRV